MENGKERQRRVCQREAIMKQGPIERPAVEADDPRAAAKRFFDQAAAGCDLLALCNINFSRPLLADEDHAVAAKYGVWGEKSMFGRKYFGVKRTTFLIDEAGRITVAVSGRAESFTPCCGPLT